MKGYRFEISQGNTNDVIFTVYTFPQEDEIWMYRIKSPDPLFRALVMWQIAYSIRYQS